MFSFNDLGGAPDRSEPPPQDSEHHSRHHPNRSADAQAGPRTYRALSGAGLSAALAFAGGLKVLAAAGRTYHRVRDRLTEPSDR